MLLLPQLVMASGSKYAGYWLGKHYKKLPEGLIRSLTMNRHTGKEKWAMEDKALLSTEEASGAEKAEL